MFRTFGFKNTSVLNGGLTKWAAEQRATHTDKDAGSEEDYKINIDESIYRNYAQISEIEKEIVSGKSDAQVVDARPEASYKAGCIPVSKNIVFKKF
jgi:thiosulfate/3-mercaptopyruvate sulfurtransferase